MRRRNIFSRSVGPLRLTVQYAPRSHHRSVVTQMVYAFSMPPTVVFQTKAEIALALLDEANVAGVSYSSNIMDLLK